jgi:hypothetical protein
MMLNKINLKKTFSPTSQNQLDNIFVEKKQVGQFKIRPKLGVPLLDYGLRYKIIIHALA